MFKKLLLPLDLTDRHEAVLALVEEMLARSAGEAILLHVIELIPGIGRDEDRAFYDRLERNARKHLEPLAHRLEAKKLHGELVILFGNRAQETLGYARQIAADLLVVTSPHFDPQRPAASLSSLSFKLSLAAPIPVLLVK
jgi:nucleotide-binding universal stress UspA family protein